MRKFVTWAVLAAVAVGMQSGSALAAGKNKGNRTPDEMFKRLDRNNDGKLSAEELQGRGKKADPAKAKARFAQLDKNNDGSVTLEEFKARGRKKK
jgi:Ca2+-binding EF-hand superfamily protein